MIYVTHNKFDNKKDVCSLPAGRQAGTIELSRNILLSLILWDALNRRAIAE